MTGILLWIVLGGIAGWIASLIMNTDGQQGLVLNVVVGIVGAMIGGFIFGLLGESPVTGFNLYSLMVAVAGAVVLLMIVKTVRN
ncbi:GlsB/YeaQ/YmgE family stress response membrane protein [Patescibacteria group bacterium]|nr:GlsB/YeaQ/YmgE family stress response membrane protein [Patescibacteria group bacterium]